MEHFAERLSLIRKDRGLTQEILAQQLGVTPQAVSRWETGACFPDMNLLNRYADVLGVSLDVLFGRLPYIPIHQINEDAQPSSTPEPIVNDSVNENETHNETNNKNGSNETASSCDDPNPAASEEGPMVKVATWQDRICTANIPVSHIHEHLVYFQNGSSADLKNMLINLTSGNVHIQRYDDPKEMHDQAGSWEDDFWGGTRIRELRMELSGFSEVEVLPSTDQRCSWTFVGEGEMSNSFTLEKQSDRLVVRSLSDRFNWTNVVSGQFQKKRYLKLFVPMDDSLHLSGKISLASSLDLQSTLENVDLQVDGSSSVRIGNCKKLRVNVSGAADFRAEKAGDSDLIQSGATSVKINQIQGDLSLLSSGASSTKIKGGHVSSLDINLSGASSLHASNLSVDEASVKLSGVCRATLGTVKRMKRVYSSRMCDLSYENE